VNSAGRTELIFVIFMMAFLFIFGCLAVFVFIRQYRREKTTPKEPHEQSD
jgi:hypothetical protein